MFKINKVKRFFCTTSYESNIVIIVKEDPNGYTKFNLTMPQYLIIKEKDDTYSLYRFSYLTDYMAYNECIGNLDAWRQCYTLIWDGSKTAKDAKETCEEHYNENKED